MTPNHAMSNPLAGLVGLVGAILWRRQQSSQGLPVNFVRARIVQHEDHFTQGGLFTLQELDYRPQRDPGGRLYRVAVSPGAYRRKGDAGQTLLRRQAQAFPVGAGEQASLAAVAASPYRPHRMNYEPGPEIPPAGGHGFACRKAALPGDNPLAFGENSRPARPVYRAVHPTATHQAGVGRVDNGISSLPGYVALEQGETGCFDSDGNIWCHWRLPAMQIVYRPLYGIGLGVKVNIGLDALAFDKTVIRRQPAGGRDIDSPAIQRP